MNIGVIGTGYVGLVTAVCLAHIGKKILCMDIDETKINKLKNNVLTIYEPKLESLFNDSIFNNNIYFTNSLQQVVNECEIIFLALPTPSNKDGSANISFLYSCCKDISTIMNSYKMIINKSTIPVGTCDELYKIISDNYEGEFDLIFSPEFLREGYAVDDFMNANRIIIGTHISNNYKKGHINYIYDYFIKKNVPIIYMDYRSAELTKYACNAFLATKITFINEIANFSKLVGSNIDKVREGMSKDERIGNMFLNPGIGYGGSCFPKDVKALIKNGEENNYDFNILKEVDKFNNKQKILIVDYLMNFFNGNILGRNISIWGLSFKENTDDIRESASIDIINFLLNKGCNIKVYDPISINKVKNIFADLISYYSNMYDCLDNSDALLIVTPWNQFKDADLHIICKKIKYKLVIDGRNIFNLEDIKNVDINYISIGRQNKISKCEIF